ncbi:VENN motif pre-toxin domain-containing protein, partial [Erwinia persicina]
LSELAAGLAGGLATGDTGGAVTAGQAGKNAVENNALSVKENQSRIEETLKQAGNHAGEQAVTDKYKEISVRQRESVEQCNSAAVCVAKANEVSGLQGEYSSRIEELGEKLRTESGLNESEKSELVYLKAVLPQLEADRMTAIHNALSSGDSEEAKQLAISTLAQAGAAGAASAAAGIGKAGNHSAGIKDNRLPIPEATVANNGFKIESNPKHTPGAPGSRPSAGVEPKNSLSLFENSISTKDPKIRLSIDNNGNIHRFFNTSKDGSGTYHWSGSAGDGKNSLGNRELGSFNKEIKELKGKK